MTESEQRAEQLVTTLMTDGRASGDHSGADLAAVLRPGRIRALAGAQLAGADLSRSNLTELSLTQADLSEATLRGADLSGTDLSGADLSGADLGEADLSGADLRGADLRGARLAGAKLGGARAGAARLDAVAWRRSGWSVTEPCPLRGARIVDRADWSAEALLPLEAGGPMLQITIADGLHPMDRVLLEALWVLCLGPTHSLSTAGVFTSVLPSNARLWLRADRPEELEALHRAVAEWTWLERCRQHPSLGALVFAHTDHVQALLNRFNRMTLHAEGGVSDLSLGSGRAPILSERLPELVADEDEQTEDRPPPVRARSRSSLLMTLLSALASVLWVVGIVLVVMGVLGML